MVHNLYLNSLDEQFTQEERCKARKGDPAHPAAPRACQTDVRWNPPPHSQAL